MLRLGWRAPRNVRNGPRGAKNWVQATLKIRKINTISLSTNNLTIAQNIEPRDKQTITN